MATGSKSHGCSNRTSNPAGRRPRRSPHSRIRVRTWCVERDSAAPPPRADLPWVPAGRHAGAPGGPPGGAGGELRQLHGSGRRRRGRAGQRADPGPGRRPAGGSVRRPAGHPLPRHRRPAGDRRRGGRSWSRWPAGCGRCSPRPRRAGRTRSPIWSHALLRDYRAAPELSRHDGEPWHLHYRSTVAGLATEWGAGCATGLAVVVDGQATGRLGVCGAGCCDRVFVDVSRNASRRFCSEACLNRTKVAAFRARSRAAT